MVTIAIVVALSPDASEGDPTADVAARLCLFLAVVAGAFVLVAPLPGTVKAWLVAGLVGLYLFAGSQLILSGSPFPPIGLAFDQGFRTASVTKFAHSISLVDFAYKDLPPFYPPLFFWVLGRLAAWADIAAYEALKVGVLLSALVIPLCAVRLWMAATRDWAIAVSVAVAGLAFTDWYEPYLWLSVVVFLPWFLLWILQVGHREDLSRGMTLAGMVIGAALVMTFYYPFFIGAVALAGLLASRKAAARRGIQLGPRFPRRTFIVLAGTAVFSAAYWLPLLIAMVTTSGARSYQNRYLEAGFVEIPLPFLDFDITGIVMSFGLVYLLLSARRSPGSAGLLALLAAAYAWIGIAYLGILIDVPLLTSKAIPFVEYTLVAAAGVGAVVVGRQVAANAFVRRRLGTGGLLVAMGGAGLLVTLANGQDAMNRIPFVTEQREATEPRALLAEFERATRGAYESSVVLTDIEQLPELLPVFVFNVWSAHYANPASQFDERSRFLDRLSSEDDSEVFAAALELNRYDPVDSIAFRPSSNGDFTYAYFEDAFPRGVDRRTFTFRAEQFDDEYFRRVDGPNLTVFLPRGNPARALDTAQRGTLRLHFPGDFEGLPSR